MFFHLEEYPDAVRLALSAGAQFNMSEKSDYADTIVTKIIDEYIHQQQGQEEDVRVSHFVERLFANCLESGELKSGLGISIEARRIDWTRKFLQSAKNAELVDLLSYCQHHVKSFIPLRSVRNQVLEIMVEGYNSATDKDWGGLVQCLYFLNRSKDVAELISNIPDTGIALQLALDVADHDDQQFSAQVVANLTPECAESLVSVLSNSVQRDLGLDFLFRNNKTDLLLLETLRSSIDQRSSVLHNGVVVAHALMQAGTTNDSFLRKNLDWLAKSNHWAKFTATASLGVVHKGQVAESMSLLSTYLPNGTTRSPYSEGGAFYALGLIHANQKNASTESFLLQSLSTSQGNEVLQVGACLGLGLTALATKSAPVYEALRNVLFLDSAVAGEAAGYAMGLVMAGSGQEAAIKDLLAYAHETHHEKIVRACAMALALIVFELEQEADLLIAQMVNDADAIVRYGGMFAIGMAYCGTSQNLAVKKLLHHSVSDVNDDVRRAAVISIGLVLANEPKELPKILKLLSQSYNPHVRYAVCIALGIGCPGMATQVPEAAALIEPLLSDVSEFVRQGALIGMSLVCQQTSGKTVFREKLAKIPGDKHEDIMCRLGALIGGGLIDIGGRNAGVNLITRGGSLRMGAAIGFCLFAQMWYWYPLMLMISLAVTPTALVGITSKLRVPKNFKVICKCPPSTFAYPPEHKVEPKGDKSKLVTAVLSAARDVVKDVAMTEQEPVVAVVEPEPTEEVLSNPCRIVLSQATHIAIPNAGETLIDGSIARYTPVIPNRVTGFVVLRDSTPNETEDLFEFGASKVETTQAAAQPMITSEEEAPPPEAFEWEG